MGVESGTPPPPEEAFLIPGRGDRIFMNPFLLGYELLSEIVAILECTKRTESGMLNFFQITAPQNQEENLDSNEPKVLLLGTPGKQESDRKAALKKYTIVRGTHRSPRQQRDIYLHQKSSYLCV